MNLHGVQFKIFQYILQMDEMVNVYKLATYSLTFENVVILETTTLLRHLLIVLNLLSNL